MKVIQIILLVCVLVNTQFFEASAQYSSYYNSQKTVDINSVVNIRSIDYGALALANAQREQNNFENQKYLDAKEREIYLAVAGNPLLAYDYGFPTGTQKIKTIPGLIKLSFQYIVPHKSLFVFAGAGRLENVSSDGVTTEINFSLPGYNKDKIVIDLEKQAKMEDMKVGELNDDEDGKIFVHKKDISRATVWGFKGFIGTLIWEDDYQYTITDNYSSCSPDGIYFFVKVRYLGNKKEVTFEQLEGRRYYLRRLLEKVISTAFIYDYSIR
jgi:hypothetical protein